MQNSQQRQSGNIFISNINWSVSQEDLVNFLETFGVGITNVKLILDRETGRSRGFAFANVDDQEVLPHAIGLINGATLMGRPLKATEAVPQSSRDHVQRPPSRGTVSQPPGSDYFPSERGDDRPNHRKHGPKDRYPREKKPYRRSERQRYNDDY